MKRADIPHMIAIESWIFDLDNTLYRARHALFPQVEKRIGAFVGDHLGIDAARARRLQKRYFHDYGSTLRGMMTVHGVDPQAFLSFVHDIDYGALPPDPALGTALGRLAGRKFVFTNASSGHAKRVLDRLGVRRHFDAVFDIEAAGYLPKPDPAAYRTLVRSFGIDPARATMFEDIARNLAPAAALGMRTVWVPGSPGWAAEGSDGDHVHHVAQDLTAWLDAAPPAWTPAP